MGGRLGNLSALSLAPTPVSSSAFDPEFLTEPLYWPEGEKDCDTLSRQGLSAFTFGGTGDGLPPDIKNYLKGRDIIILADNDGAGNEHAIVKAERAHASGATSVRLVEFPELPLKGDVSDFLKNSSVKDLEALRAANSLLGAAHNYRGAANCDCARTRDVQPV